MSKAKRLIELMITINAKRDFTVGELAREFSVSKRTILRDLQALEHVGFPLYSQVGAAGGYHVLKERVLPPITFSESEAKAIFLACQSLEFYRDLPFKQETVSVLKKFLNCLPTDMQHNITQIQNKILFWIPDRHCRTPLLAQLYDIVIHNYAVTIQYSSERAGSTRTIVPIGLYAMNGLWYCPAFCMKSNAVREFRADRIEKIIEVHKTAEHKAGTSVRDYLEHADAENGVHIKIRLTDMGVKRCETEFLLARGLKRLSSGGIIEMEIPHSYLEWVADYLLALGTNAAVVEPEELTGILRDKTKVLYDHYGSQKQRRRTVD